MYRLLNCPKVEPNLNLQEKNQLPEPHYWVLFFKRKGKIARQQGERIQFQLKFIHFKKLKIHDYFIYHLCFLFVNYSLMSFGNFKIRFFSFSLVHRSILCQKDINPASIMYIRNIFLVVCYSILLYFVIEKFYSFVQLYLAIIDEQQRVSLRCIT